MFHKVYPELQRIFHGIRKPSRTILLHGPPGTGKTSLVQQVAKTMHLQVYEMCPSIILSKWVGQSVKTIRNIFDCAASNAPAIIVSSQTLLSPDRLTK
mmetsp:Transcript_16012/g.19437  ORF Transcript_16012/g.19437 Transcript_16012/m.19437 type:complete len:98 (+) Transcript_16012:346-639(+)